MTRVSSQRCAARATSTPTTSHTNAVRMAPSEIVMPATRTPAATWRMKSSASVANRLHGPSAVGSATSTMRMRTAADSSVPDSSRPRGVTPNAAEIARPARVSPVSSSVSSASAKVSTT